jgi:hypothetical protein
MASADRLHGDGRSGLDESLRQETLMERVVEAGNLRRALKRVQRNKGSPGVDGLTVKEPTEVSPDSRDGR